MFRRSLRFAASACALFVVALVTSTAAIAGIGGIGSHNTPINDDVIEQVKSGTIGLEEAEKLARAAGFELAIQ